MWATRLVEVLTEGYPIKFRPRGHSMKGLISSGDEVLLTPFTDSPKKGDIVLCKVKGRFYLHLIKAVQEDRYQIGNNRGFVNGWTSRDQLYGRVSVITPRGQR